MQRIMMKRRLHSLPLQELLAGSSTSPTPFLFALDFCSSLLILPLAPDWSNKVLTVTILGAAVCLQVYYLAKASEALFRYKFTLNFTI
jgi:hypothetical protein